MFLVAQKIPRPNFVAWLTFTAKKQQCHRQIAQFALKFLSWLLKTKQLKILHCCFFLCSSDCSSNRSRETSFAEVLLEFITPVKKITDRTCRLSPLTWLTENLRKIEWLLFVHQRCNPYGFCSRLMKILLKTANQVVHFYNHLATT